MGDGPSTTCKSGINIQLAKMENSSARPSFARYVDQGSLWPFTLIENPVRTLRPYRNDR